MIELMLAALPLAVPSAPWLNGGKAPESPENVVAGHDWMNDSGLRCGCYDPSGNMLLNPSFESGRRYWVAIEERTAFIEDQIVTNVARTGRCSLLLRPWKPCGTACLVVDTNTDYVVSLYARSENDTQFSVVGKGVQNQVNKGESFKVVGGGKWQRIVYRFRSGPLQRETQISFRVGPHEVYVDDVQLERGTEATPYHGNPFALELLLDSPERSYCDARTDSKPRIRLAGPVGSTGKLRVSVTDVFQRKIFTAAKRFKLGKTGEVFLPLDDKALPKGTLVATVTVTPDPQLTTNNQQPTTSFTDYLRWTKIDYLDNTHLHKNLMLRPSLEGHVHDGTMKERHYRRMAHFGFGGYNYGEPESEEDVAMMTKYHVDTFDSHWCTGSWWLRKQKLNGKPYEWDGVYYDLRTNFPTAFLSWIEDNVAAAVRDRSLISRFALATEPMGEFTVLNKFELNAKDEYAKFILANYRGMKRGNPAAELMPYGAWNMFEQGRWEIADMLRRVKALDPNAPGYFPFVEVHSYRPRPIVEDDLVGFFQQLDRAGYPKIGVRIGEGSYYYPMWRQSYDVQRGCAPKGEYERVCVIPSYDLGWGERFSAMCVVREALWYYRHADRVKTNCSWNPAWLSGSEPIAWAAANNALANLLGNATFVEDVRFATDSRALVFDDGKGRTVAAVWREDADFDDGKAPGTTMTMAKMKGLEVLDLMGNRCAIEQSNNPNNRTITLPLSGFVVYLRVGNEQRKSLLKALKGAKSAADENVFPFVADFAIKGPAKGEIIIGNQLAGDYDVTVTADGRTEKLTLPAGGKKTVMVDLAESAVVDEAKVSVNTAVVKVARGIETQVAFTNRLTSIPYAKSPIDWSKVPIVKTGDPISTWWVNSSDFDELQNKAIRRYRVKAQRAWNERGLYLRFDVDDELPPSFCTADKLEGDYRGRYAHRRARLLVDPFCDALSRERYGLGKKCGWDDFAYDFVPITDKKAVCRRFLAPDLQLAGGVMDELKVGLEPRVRVDFRVRKGGYVYEIDVPYACLMPLELKAGQVFGMAYEVYGAVPKGEKNPLKLPAMRWNDNSDHIPHGEGKPTIWPQCILVK